MTFLPLLVHTIRFILRSGGKSDLTSDDLERSVTSITSKLTFFHDSVAICNICCQGISLTKSRVLFIMFLG